MFDNTSNMSTHYMTTTGHLSCLDDLICFSGKPLANSYKLPSIKIVHKKNMPSASLPQTAGHT
jgi:hypothetical protein